MVRLHPFHNPRSDGDGLVLLRPTLQKTDFLALLSDCHTGFRNPVLILGYQ